MSAGLPRAGGSGAARPSGLRRRPSEGCRAAHAPACDNWTGRHPISPTGLLLLFLSLSASPTLPTFDPPLARRRKETIFSFVFHGKAERERALSFLFRFRYQRRIFALDVKWTYRFVAP